MSKEPSSVSEWNTLLSELGQLGHKKGTQKEALNLFIENRDFIWEFLIDCNGEKILKELELMTQDREFICSIIQIFIIIKFEATVRDMEKGNE